MEKDAKRDARVEELEARLATLEQGSSVVDRHPQNDKEVIAEVQVCLSKCPASADDASGSVIDQQDKADIKPVEEVIDKEIDDFIPKEAVNVPDSIIAQPEQYKPVCEARPSANNIVSEI